MIKKEDNMIDELPYEVAYKELMELVESLEANIHSLDETMRLFERGQLLAQRCTTLLEKAELRIRQLSSGNEIGMEE